MYNPLNIESAQTGAPDKRGTNMKGIALAIVVAGLLVVGVWTSHTKYLVGREANLKLEGKVTGSADEYEKAIREKIESDLVKFNEDASMVDALVREWHLSKVMADANVIVTSSAWTAAQGGNGGSPFELYSGGSYIKKICLRHGAFVDKITVTFANNQVASAGGNGGSESCKSLTLVQNCFGNVHVRAGQFVDKLTFFERTPAQLALSGGGNGGGLSKVYASFYCLVGIKGRSGAYIDQVSFKYLLHHNPN